METDHARGGSPTPDILSVAAQELQGTRLYHYNTAVLVYVPLNNNPCCSGRQLKLWPELASTMSRLGVTVPSVSNAASVCCTGSPLTNHGVSTRDTLHIARM